MNVHLAVHLVEKNQGTFIYVIIIKISYIIYFAKIVIKLFKKMS